MTFSLTEGSRFGVFALSKSISLAQDEAKSRVSCRILGSSRLSQATLLGKQQEQLQLTGALPVLPTLPRCSPVLPRCFFITFFSLSPKVLNHQTTNELS